MEEGKGAADHDRRRHRKRGLAIAADVHERRAHHAWPSYWRRVANSLSESVAPRRQHLAPLLSFFSSRTRIATAFWTLTTRACAAGSDLRHEANSAAARKYVHALTHELERKAALFNDDAAFVVEVQEGCSQAPGMDPQRELKTLKTRFTAFKRDFKVR